METLTSHKSGLRRHMFPFTRGGAVVAAFEPGFLFRQRPTPPGVFWELPLKVTRPMMTLDTLAV